MISRQIQNFIRLELSHYKIFCSLPKLSLCVFYFQVIMSMMKKLKSGPMLMKKHRTRSSIIRSLPQDMLIEVAIQLASKSSTPLNDIRRLRATCKSFHIASRDKLVGRWMAVDKEVTVQWDENNSYLALLRNCADCGNLDAHFILGVEELYNARRAISGLQHLQLVMDGGHLAAAYLTGVGGFVSSTSCAVRCHGDPKQGILRRSFQHGCRGYRVHEIGESYN